MSEADDVQAKPWRLLWAPLPDEREQYERDAIAEATATRPDQDQPEDMG